MRTVRSWIGFWPETRPAGLYDGLGRAGRPPSAPLASESHVTNDTGFEANDTKIIVQRGPAYKTERFLRDFHHKLTPVLPPSQKSEVNVRNELNRTWAAAPKGNRLGYHRIAGYETPKQAAPVLPMLDWPTDLFSRFIAEVTDEPDYLAA
jgi:hypothetical protein